MAKTKQAEVYGKQNKKVYRFDPEKTADPRIEKDDCPLCKQESSIRIDRGKKQILCQSCEVGFEWVGKQTIMPKEPKIEKAKAAARIRNKKKEKDEYQEKSKKIKGQGEFEFKYIYTDPKGKPAHATLRWKNPKSFSQQHWTGKKWEKGLGKTRRYLYRLVELIKSKNSMVFLPEGEKDCQPLAKWGLTVTTCPMGAGKWKPEYNEWLKNRDVCLIPDQNDKPPNPMLGVESAEKVAYSLIGTAKSTRILLLPRKDKKIIGFDPSDWIEAGGTKEKLIALVKKTKAITPKELEKRIAKRVKERKARPKFIDPKLIKRKKWTLRPGLINLVKSEERICWLLKNEKGKLYIKKEEIEDSYNDKDELIKRIIRYPRQDLPIEYASPGVLEMQGKVKFDELLRDIITFIKTYLEMPEPAHYLIMALWVLHTYLMEKFNTTPILSYYGVHNTGKTRAGDILREISLRGYALTTPTEASIFRETHYFQTCIVIDEVKLGGFLANEPVRDLVHSRYKRGMTICRVEITKSGEEQLEYYNVYGPTCLCSTRYVEATLKSRCIEFLMQENQDPEVERPIDYEKAQELRNKLTIFRASFLDMDLPEYKRIAPRRLNELLLPLYQVLMLVDPERKKEFDLIVETLEKKRTEEMGLTLEADVVRVIIEGLDGVIGLKCITTKKITEVLNMGIENKKDMISNYRVGRACARLGFESWRDTSTPTNERGYRITRELLKKLCEKYEIEFSEM